MIPINELFSEPAEQHAWLVGMSHGFFFWQKHPPLTEEQKDEQHYYEQGKIAGMFLWLPFVVCQVLIGWLIKVIIF